MKKQKNKTKNKTIVGSLLSSFDCSGSFQLKNPFNISVFAKDKHQMIINFPHPPQEQLENAIKHGKKSGFGKGTENVVDQSYRFAYEYLPDELGLPSALTQHIFNEVTKAIGNSLGCDSGVRAELIKLNIYPKGGLFKKHVDSPKKEAFGSLVVFLPCFFTGGELIVQNKSDKHSFNFGGNKEENKIEWAAFYNDCLHEITEVTAGYRLTLSYNLFFEGPSKVNVFPKQQIIKVLSELQNGKTYGYFCQHYYGNNALKNSQQKVEQMRLLKGKDYDIYVALKALGATKIQLKVLYQQLLMCIPSKFEAYEKQKQQRMKSASKTGYNPFINDPYMYKDEQRGEQPIMLVGPPSQIQKPMIGWQEGENQFYEDQLIILKQKLKTQIWGDYPRVVWLNQRCQGSNYNYAFNAYYGNDYTINEKYCQLILIIHL